MHKLDRTDLQRGVVCATAGNHGRAVARVRPATRECRARSTCPPPARRHYPPSLAVRVARVNAMRRDGAEIVEATGSVRRSGRASRVAGRRNRSGAALRYGLDRNRSDRALDHARLHACVRRSIWQVWAGCARRGDRGGRRRRAVAAAASWFAFHYGSRRRGSSPANLRRTTACSHRRRPDTPWTWTIPEKRVLIRHQTPGLPPHYYGGAALLEALRSRVARGTDGIDGFVAISDAIVLDDERLAHPVDGDRGSLRGPLVPAALAHCSRSLYGTRHTRGARPHGSIHFGHGHRDRGRMR